MVKKTVLLITFLCFLGKMFPNDVSITTPVLINPAPVEKHVYVDFDMSWQNSWRNSTNYDAIWIFMKYKINNGAWQHAYFDTNSSSHSVMNENGTGAFIEPAINNIGGNNRCVGLFMFRANNGTGNVNWENVQLKWNYGENGVGNNDSVTVKIFAIEMVYVPEGAFWIGDGASFSRFHAGNNQNTPFQITSSPIQFGNTASNLWALGAWDNPSGTLNTAYPTGFNAFYCMKYSITQWQYVDFLNTLTRTQQNERTATDLSPAITNVSSIFVMSASATPSFRNGIRCQATINANDAITFYCDLNNNGIMNENTDGQHIACNYLSWADGAAYAAWAGLRPMTETEYEKACRGTATPIAGEYAWGSTYISGADFIYDDGAANESSSLSTNCVYNNAAGVQGPMRVGVFANISSNRELSGATVYGAMEMSGNLWERVVSLGSAAGRNFNGQNSDGSLPSNGNANVSTWPGTNAVGSGLRGNHWKGTNFNAKISARDNGSYETAIRNEMFGFRAVRTP